MSVNRNIVLLASLAVIVVAVVAYLAWPSSPKSAALEARQRAMEMLGARIAKLQPEGKVLVLSNPFTKDSSYLNEKNQFERAGLRGLRDGLNGRSSVKVVFPEIRPEYLSSPQSIVIPPDSRTPLSFLIQPASVDQLAEANPECRVVVSLIGLPLGVDRLKLWSEKDPRAFALLLPDLRVLGPPERTVAAFERGKLLAVVVEDAKSGEPLVVSRENIVEVLKQQPKALGY